ncbi:MAG: tetratricopeptide repeat protein [bacterium]
MSNVPQPQSEPARTTKKENNSPDIIQELTKEALAAFYRYDDETALELLLGVLELTPDNVRIHYLTALCATTLNDEETLEAVYQKARKNKPRHPYVVGCEAVRALFFANFERAEHLFNLALRSLPDDIDLSIGLGILYDQLGAEEKSAAVYRRVLEQNPDNIRARISLGISYALSGEYFNALTEYQYAKKLDPTVENPHQHLGRDYYADGMFNEAATEFALAITEEPNQPAAYFYLMDCYKRLGMIDDAIDVYEIIRSRFHHQPELISHFYEHFRMFPELISALEQLLKNTPGDIELLVRLTNAYRETGRLNDALTAIQRAIAEAPEETAFWTILGEIHYARREYIQAIAAAQRAVQLDRYEEGAYNVLSDAFLFLGRIEEAERVERQLTSIRNENWRRYHQKFSGQDKADEFE